MKTINKLAFALLFTFIYSLSPVIAQNNTQAAKKNGNVVEKLPVIETDNSFTDSRDGNVYQTVTIGDQVWMAENLRYLPSVVIPDSGSRTKPFYYVYGYFGTDVEEAKATSNYNTYGVLYNWPAAMNETASSAANPSGVKGVCPTGWHLPSEAEWTELENYLADNGYNYDGTIGGGSDKIAKSMAGTSGWVSSSTKGAVGNSDFPEYRNKSGFTALPAGYRGENGTFFFIRVDTGWWSATQFSSPVAYYNFMYYYNNSLYRDYIVKDLGFSVRCVQDLNEKTAEE